MTACYHGPADRLIDLVKDLLAGKEVTVPTREPDTKEDRDRRNQEVNDVLTGRRAWKK